MNMFELFKYGPQVIVKLTIDVLQVIFKLTKQIFEKYGAFFTATG